MNKDISSDSGTENVGGEILILGSPARSGQPEVTRGGLLASKFSEVTQVEVSHLQSQINGFLKQLNSVMSETPESVGDFKLTEFEVTAGIVIQGKGQIGIAILGAVELSGQTNAGIKFVFKR